MIQGVCITPLRQISDERGKVMHMMRVDKEPYIQFGEIYFSCINPGAVKAWKLHKEMTLNCAVPHGEVKFVLYDDRQDSMTRGLVQEVMMGVNNYCLLTVPPMIWTGFQCVGDEMAILSNCATLPHQSDECERCAEDAPSIPYHWRLIR